MTSLSSGGLSSRHSRFHRNACRILLFLLTCLPLPAVGAQEQPSKPQATDTFALYTRCSFRPQGPGCAAAYQEALTQNSPGAAAVRRAFHDYAHYLTPADNGLTAADRQFLADSAITLPLGLTGADMAGLHNVINDPALSGNKTARQAAVNNFLSRAVEAGLYCDLGTCQSSSNTAVTDKTTSTAS